ncbi:MAG: hypothetical protein WA821_22750 [Anaerolineales bacterium]
MTLATDETILKDTCYYLTPEYAKSFWGKYVWLYQKKGTLLLTRNSLAFRNKSFSIDIPLKAISSIETKTFSQLAKPIKLAQIIVNYVENEKESTIHLVPLKSPFKPVWDTNKVITGWVERFEQTPELSGRIKRPLQIPPQPAKWKIALFKSVVVLYLLFAFSTLAWGWFTLNWGSFQTPVLTEKSSIQDSSSRILKTLLRKDDFPGNWEWANITRKQPSHSPFSDTGMDSAFTDLNAKVPQFIIFKHYVYITQWAELYDSPMSETQFKERIPIVNGDETSFAPQVNKAGKYTYAMCEKGSDFYSCTVSTGYERVVSSIMTITPQQFGEQFTIDLLNSMVKITDQRVSENFP